MPTLIRSLSDHVLEMEQIYDHFKLYEPLNLQKLRKSLAIEN